MHRALAGLLLGAALAGCDSGKAPAQSFCITPFMPVPVVYFVYPGSGVNGVSPSIGELVFAGATTGYAIGLSSNGRSITPTGPLHRAPFPLPSPLVPPPPGITTYSSVTIGPLAAGSTYAVSYSYTGATGTPPDCVGTITRQLGSFTTR